LLLGTSLSMGLGVAQDETYAAFLERILNEESSGIRYEVINLARGAYGVDDMIDILEKFGGRFDPDIILIEPRWTSKGLHPVPILQEEHSLSGFLSRYFKPASLAAWSFFYQAVHHEYIPTVEKRISGWRESIKQWTERTERPVPVEDELNRAVEDYLLRIQKAAHGVPVAIVTLRPMEELTKPVFRNQNQIFLFQKYGFVHFDTSYEDYGTDTLKMIIFPGDHHPNKKAHRIYAESIYRQMKERGFLH